MNQNHQKSTHNDPQNKSPLLLGKYPPKHSSTDVQIIPFNRENNNGNNNICHTRRGTGLSFPKAAAAPPLKPDRSLSLEIEPKLNNGFTSTVPRPPFARCQVPAN